MKICTLYKVSIMFLLALSVAGCKKDFLDVARRDAIAADDTWKDFQGASLFMANIYSTGFNGDYMFGVDPFDNWSDNCMATFDYVTSRTSMARYDFSSSNSPVGADWARFYGLIRACNIALVKAPASAGMTDEQKALITGQAKFLRGYFFGELIKRFGGVPLVDKVLDRTDGSDLNYPRSTYNESIDFVRKDLQEAAALLPKEYTAVEYGKATKGAALALKGEIELYAAKWVEAATTNKALIDGSSGAKTYKLVDDYADIYDPLKKINDEVIFDIPYDGITRGEASDIYLSPRVDPTTKVPVGFGHLCPTQELIDCYGFTDGTPGNSPLHANDPYKNRDKRFYASILYDGSNWRTANDTVFTRVDPTLPSGAIANNYGANQSSATGYYFHRYIDPAITPTEAHYYGKPIGAHNAVVLRYAEVLLNYAEAQNEVAGPDGTVYTALNAIRLRTGLPNITSGLSKDQMRDVIRNERRVELAFEGKRFWDILRWKIGLQLLNKSMTAMKIEKQANGTFTYTRVPAIGSEKRFSAEKFYLFPIPQSAIDKNPKLKGQQNPGF